MSEAERIEAVETEEEQEFEIRDDQTADWAVRKIKDADAELERMETWFKAQLTAAKDRHDQTVAYFSGKLARYMETVPARETKTTRKYELASGELVITKEKTDFKATDSEALLGWCQENDPTLVKVVLEPAWASVKKRLQMTDAGIVDTETGAIVDGVEQVTKPAEFKVKTK